MFKVEIEEGLKPYRAVKFVTQCVELLKDSSMAEFLEIPDEEYLKPKILEIFNIFFLIFLPDYKATEDIQKIKETIKTFEENHFKDLSNYF